MPVAQNVDTVLFNSWTIEYYVRTGNQEANAKSFAVWRADERKILEHCNSVDQRMTDARGGLRIISGNETNDGF